MSIWVHKEIGDLPSFEEISSCHCRFCKEPLIKKEINDSWEHLENKIDSIHNETILGMAEIHGDFILREMEIKDTPYLEKATLGTCPLCGWWNISKNIQILTKNQIWMLSFGSAAALKNMNHADISTPTDEIKQYLSAKYDDRFHIHPRKFEEIVASVFRIHDFHPELTSYSADGGIDIILRDKTGNAIAVQVKRYKNSIEASAIRELLGAMVINGNTRGVFVTTSTFQSGCIEIKRKAEKRGILLDIIDSNSFLNILKLSQAKNLPQYQETIQETIIPSVELEPCGEFHLNSL